MTSSIAQSGERATTRTAAPEPRTSTKGWKALPLPVRHLALAALALTAELGLLLATSDMNALRVATVGYTMLAIAGLQLLVGGSGQVSLGQGAFMKHGASTMAHSILHQPMVLLARKPHVILLLSVVV